MNGNPFLRAIRWLGVATIVLFLAVAALALLNYRISQHERKLANCLSAWANDTSSRTAVLSKLANERTNALDALIRSVPSARTNPEQFHRNVVLYIIASDAYKKELMRNPLPAPPAVRC